MQRIGFIAPPVRRRSTLTRRCRASPRNGCPRAASNWADNPHSDAATPEPPNRGRPVRRRARMPWTTSAVLLAVLGIRSATTSATEPDSEVGASGISDAGHPAEAPGPRLGGGQSEFRLRAKLPGSASRSRWPPINPMRGSSKTPHARNMPGRPIVVEAIPFVPALLPAASCDNRAEGAPWPLPPWGVECAHLAATEVSRTEARSEPDPIKGPSERVSLVTSVSSC